MSAPHLRSLFNQHLGVSPKKALQDIRLSRAREALEQDGYHTMTYRIRHRDGHYLWA